MCFFTVFMALFVIFLNVLWWNLPNVLQHITSSEIRILNTRQVFRCFQILPLQKNCLIDFPEKRAPTEVNYLLPICQILRNLTEGNARKFIVSFAFCAHVDVIKYEICDFSFYFVCSCWRHQKHWRSPSSARRLLELSSSARVRS